MKQTDFSGLDLPPKPEKPLPEECCGRGCEHCVYVYYEDALLRWEDKVEKLKREYLASQIDSEDK